MSWSVEGTSEDEVFARIGEMKSQDARWDEGKTFSLVYPTGREDVDRVLKRASDLYLYENALNPIRFPSLRLMEADIVGMTGELVHLPADGGGTLSSGGSESILMSVLVNRDRARAERGIERGNIVYAESAHAAFAKAAHYLELEARPVPLAEGFVADVDAMSDAVDDRTVLMVGSAYGYPHGVMDPIEELSTIALDRGIGFHSDTCIGAFVLPFLERLGYEVPLYDFRLPGVTEMSCDVHKYGYNIKGTSVILHRKSEWIGYQYFLYNQWPSGLYGTPTVAGARPAAPIASAWAVMNYLGVEGYLELMRTLMATTKKIREGIEAIGPLKIMGNPIGPLLTFTSDEVDPYAVCDLMDDRGWNLDRNTNPNGLHMMISPIHARYADEFLTDLAWATRNCGESRGLEARYN
ncbi:MAG: pyridoxal-dependent decarboxylase [Candidatus Nanopelagicales bacterium]|nr:pyridoxal-dependent decarboxylase [Candidatus Nanopelagicales bacterium]